MSEETIGLEKNLKGSSQKRKPGPKTGPARNFRKSLPEKNAFNMPAETHDPHWDSTLPQFYKTIKSKSDARGRENARPLKAPTERRRFGLSKQN